MLLERGEEDLAVLIARADLPEILDSGRDAPTLAALGLGGEELRGLLPALSGGSPGADGATLEEMARMTRTISDRWAHLVSVWTGNAGDDGAT